MGSPTASAGSREERLRALPSVEAVLAAPEHQILFVRRPRARIVAAVREALRAARQRILGGGERGFESADLTRALGALETPRLRTVLNATGVVLHTNLGRAPLVGSAVARMAEAAQGYCNLELDLDEGERGSRDAPLVGTLCRLTGAEDALVVNNCAAATLLVLTALAEGREVIVSRGELVEIGGGFRIPDVMRQSRATLVEVGTTNRTRRSDYERALGPSTALLAKVHRSNFAIVGFTEEVPVAELVRLCQPRGIPVFVDAGSGQLTPLAVEGAQDEPTMRAHVDAGADLVAFSGDKLLGGPQAGIVVGRAPLLARLRGHPLARALRVDKLTIAALEGTLALYLDGEEDSLPARSHLLQSAEALRQRADRLRSALAAEGVRADQVETVGQVGGGTMPLGRPVSWGCSVVGDAERIQGRLREGTPAVVGRIVDGRVVLDVRCLADSDLDLTAAAVAAALATTEPC